MQKKYLSLVKKNLKINTMTLDDTNRVLKTGMAMYNILVDGDDEQTENYHLISDDERRVWERAHDHAEKAINEWTKTLNDIMNMNVEEINAKDVKQRFKETKKYGIYING